MQIGPVFVTGDSVRDVRERGDALYHAAEITIPP